MAKGYIDLQNKMYVPSIADLLTQYFFLYMFIYRVYSTQMIIKRTPGTFRIQKQNRYTLFHCTCLKFSDISNICLMLSESLLSDAQQE